MSADLSSPDDYGDDLIITLATTLLAACDLAINKTASFHEILTVDEIRRRSGKIRHHALQHLLSSPFWDLFNSKHDDALITLCGFDHASFELLYQLFKPYFDFTPCRKKTEFIAKNSITKSSRSRLLCSISCLALGLAWTRTRGSYMILQIIFGLTHGSLNIWLRLSRRMIVKVLQTNEDAIVRLPTAAETTLFASMIHKKYPLVNIFGEQWMI